VTKARACKVAGQERSPGVKECRNLSLGLTTKARAYKVAGQEESPGVKESVRE